jgi:hypothetical protein
VPIPIEKMNQAMRVYRRLGFELEQHDGVSHLVRRTAPAAAQAGRAGRH